MKRALLLLPLLLLPGFRHRPAPRYILVRGPCAPVTLTVQPPGQPEVTLAVVTAPPECIKVEWSTPLQAEWLRAQCPGTAKSAPGVEGVATCPSP